MNNKEYKLLELTIDLDTNINKAIVLVIRNGQPYEVYSLPYYDYPPGPFEVSEEKP